MRELVKFSLKRRFFNHATILLNILLCVVVCGVVFADRIIDLVNPSMLDHQKIFLMVDHHLQDALMELDTQGVEFLPAEGTKEALLNEAPKAYVLYYEEGYKLYSQYEIPKEMKQMVTSVLQNIHQNMVLSESLTEQQLKALNQEFTVENVVVNQEIEMNSDKQNLVFMVMTSIYFTMLSFSTSVANEVIYEKSTRQLELILTSVSAKTHFLSKMLVGWLGIVVQAICLGVDVVLALMLRICFDEGRGLIQLVNKLGWMVIQEETIFEFIRQISIESEFMIQLFFIFFFLMMGILLLQMVLVVLSSFIANIEEAGNVQGPFYLILLAVYYFALSMNTPYQMSEGVGFVCSFLPFLNMLFMPCRLLIQNVSILELSLSAFISCGFMMFILLKGPYIYQKGVLDYTSRGFLGIMKKTFEKENI